MVNEGFPEAGGIGSGETTTSTFPGAAKGPDDSASVGLANSILSGASDDALPDPPVPDADEVVELPGGLLLPDGSGSPKLVREVQVRELTGADEERLAKASASKNQYHFFNTMLETVIVRIGDEAPTPATVRNLLIGDREAIIFGIRRLTYGTTFELFGWANCPYCDEVSDLSLDLFDEDTIPVRRLADPIADREFDVKLRKGRVAHVRMLTGLDQMEIAKVPDAITWPERNSMILKRVVTTITDADGKQRLVAASPSLVVNLGSADRRAILTELAKRSPGPQYTDIKFTHPPCNKEVSLSLGLADLFQG